MTEEARTALALRLRAALDPGRVWEGAPLAPYTTWRVGGPADLLCLAERTDEVVQAVQAATELGAPWRVLGRGSNVLVRDGGLVGLVILNRAGGLLIEGAEVGAQGGLLLSTLARRTAAAGLAGLEWCAGIPGSVGGAIVSNAGAHGGEMKDTLRRVLLLAPGARAHWEDAAALGLAYRHSRLREGDTPGEVVLEAVFSLTPTEPERLRERMAEQRRQRQATQPLSQPTAGSVFKNPPGQSAARLIDQTGLKGLRVGGAHVSRRHANFMVTGPGAQAADLLQLIALVRQRVRERFDVELSLEVQPIGRDALA